MRLTLRTDLAIRTLMTCATRAPEMLRTADVAKLCNASFHHVAQVVNQLESAGYLRTLRGRNGGISLMRPATEINLGDVVHIFEGEHALVECMDAKTNTCPLAGACRATCVFTKALESFYAVLNKASLFDLIDDNAALQGILAPR
jgi:Rrf2 family nitric oxide-sensitive transcriptional repressor